jgi:hypothetical protein
MRCILRDLTEFEGKVLEKLLDGDHPVLRALRAQASACSLAHREWTGAGFFLTFHAATDAERAPVDRPLLRFGDVVAELEGVANGMGFVLVVEDGFIESLEGYTFEEPCPENPKLLRLRYSSPRRRELPF